MKRKVSENSFEKPHIEEGLHHAEFLAEKPTTDGKYGPRIIAEFKVYHSDEIEPVTIGAFFGLDKDGNIPKKGRYMEALKALGAEEIEEIDTDDYLGKQCRVMVEDYKDKDENVASGITKVKPADEKTPKFIEAVKKKFGNSTEKEAVDVDEIL